MRGRTRRKGLVLDLLSLTEEAAMWQKSAFAKREEVVVQLQEDVGFVDSTFERMDGRGGGVVVMRTCVVLAVDEFVDN